MNNIHELTMRRYLPTFTALQCFEASARHLNFTYAAKELNLTQSAVSHQVRNLETFLGVEMFKRVGKRLMLTPQGEGYAKDVAQNMDALEASTLSVMTRSQPANILNLGTLPTFGSHWLIPKLADFAKKHPEIQLNLETGTEAFDVHHSNLDLAIQFGNGVWPDTVAHKIVEESTVAVCTPALLDEVTDLEPQDVQSFPLLRLKSRSSAWLDWMQAQGITPAGFISGPCFEQFDMLIRAARAGLGVAVLPTIFVEDELESGELITPFGGPVVSSNAYYLVYSQHKSGDDNIKAFRDWVLCA
ncbi:MAG: transcriptional regulator GcvA [Methylocystaceae bacterium]|nr:transcriptional regulator GcvA [Methylocystaceae bacterium]